MKGLLVKDYKFMKAQKNFFLIVVAIMIGMSIYTEDPAFIFGYMSFISATFTLSTISYDEFDNGNLFLFSLPITRKSYIIEKYEFGLIMSGVTWLITVVIAAVTGMMKDSILIVDILKNALTTLPMFLLFLAVMLPFQFKFGGEKGRIASIGAVGLTFIIGVTVVKIAEVFHIDLISIFSNLLTMSKGMLIAVTIVITATVLFLSFKISLSIMEKKEL